MRWPETPVGTDPQPGDQNMVTFFAVFDECDGKCTRTYEVESLAQGDFEVDDDLCAAPYARLLWSGTLEDAHKDALFENLKRNIAEARKELDDLQLRVMQLWEDTTRW